MPLDNELVADSMRRKAEHLDQVSLYLIGRLKHKNDKEAVKAFAAVQAVMSFLRVEAEEIETGQCCCRHVPNEDKEPCARCNDTGTSEFVRAIRI